MVEEPTVTRPGRAAMVRGIAWFVAVVIASAGAMLLLERLSSPSRPEQRPWKSEDREAFERIRGESLQSWASAELVELADAPAERVVATVRGAIDGGAPELPEAQRSALAGQLAEEIALRTRLDPEEVVARARADAARVWVSPDDERRWFALNTYLESFAGRSFDPSDPEAALEEIVRTLAEREHGRFEAIGRAATGNARCRICRVGSWDELMLRQDESYDSRADQIFWHPGPTVGALRLDDPERELERAFRRHGRLDVAEFRALVRTTDGRLAMWYSDWFWDPSRQAWRNASMGQTGKGLFSTFY